ncbi:MAG: 2-dehydropantoate 2-reductase N-terminal domain-containing protein [Deinococcota bacterium]
MAKITVLGAGVMGTAFCVPLVDNGHDVHLVGTHLDQDIITTMQAGKPHPRLGVHISGLSLYQHEALSEALKETDLLVLGVSSAGIGWATKQLAEHLTQALPIAALTKGLSADLQVLPKLLQNGLPADYREQVRLLAITGPCIAGELAVRRDSSVILAGDDPDTVSKVRAWLETDYYHVWPSHDLIGCEACAALKNLYALVIGTAKGKLEQAGEADNKALMHNLSSSMFAQALAEMRVLISYMGGDAASVDGLPGAGDLYVTCQAGRNGRMGRLLGLGLPFSRAKAEHMAEDTVEGAELAKTIAAEVFDAGKQGKLDAGKLPLLHLAIAMVTQDAPAEIPWKQFFKA